MTATRQRRPALPVVLDTRVVSGTGGGPDKTILNSPRFLTAAGYRMLCAYMHPPGDPGLDALRSKAEAWQAPLLTVPDRGPWDWQVVTRMLAICRENLNPGGVAYISYSVYPGAHVRRMLAEMLQYHARRFASPGEQIEQAQAMLAFLAACHPGDDAYSQLLTNPNPELSVVGTACLALVGFGVVFLALAWWRLDLE